MKTGTNGYHSEPPHAEVREGHGRVPLWLWLLIGVFVLLAFLVSPFRLF